MMLWQCREVFRKCLGRARSPKHSDLSITSTLHPPPQTHPTYQRAIARLADPPTSAPGAQGASSSVHQSNEATFPFLKLPAELRNRIYRLLLSGTTIHIDGTNANPTNEDQLIFWTCTVTTIDYRPLDELSVDTPTSTDYAKWKPCDGSLDITKLQETVCPQDNGVHLDVQLLRVCRQIHNEAGLIPYAENCFITSCFDFDYYDLLVEKIGLKQREAIRTVAMFDDDDNDDGRLVRYRGISIVPELFPGIERLWINVNHFFAHKEGIVQKLALREDSYRAELVFRNANEDAEELAREKLQFLQRFLLPVLGRTLIHLDSSEDVKCVVRWSESD